MKKNLVYRLLALVLALMMLCSCAAPAQSNTDQTATTTEQTPAAETETTTDSEETTAQTPATTDGILHLALDEQSGKDQVKAAWGDPGGFYRTGMFSRLLKVDTDDQPTIPDLAESYSVSDDQLTYTFVVRSDATWHDGEPITAEDVRWSAEMALKSAQITTIISSSLQSIEGAQEYIEGTADTVSGITADGQTVTFKLSSPNGDFLMAMAQWAPYPKHLLEGEDPLTLHTCSFWQAPVGSGPYKFKEFQPGSYLILEAYDGYYGEQPGIKTVQLTVTSDSQLVTKTQAGELDLSEFSDYASVEQVLSANPALTSYEIEDAMYLRVLSFNLNGNDKLQDIRVRQAISQAIDKQTICDQLFNGQAMLMNTLVPTSRVEYNADAQTLSYDPDTAKALLEEAGYDFSQPIRIAYFYSDQQTIDLMDTLKYYLEQVGFTVELNFLKGDLLDLIYTTRDYDMIYRGLSSTGAGEIYGWQKAGSIHEAIYGTSLQEGWADLLNRYTEAGVEERIEVVKELQAHEIEACEDIPLWNLKTYVVVNSSRLNLPTQFQYGVFNYERHLEQWHLK